MLQHLPCCSHHMSTLSDMKFWVPILVSSWYLCRIGTLVALGRLPCSCSSSFKAIRRWNGQSDKTHICVGRSTDSACVVASCRAEGGGGMNARAVIRSQLAGVQINTSMHRCLCKAQAGLARDGSLAATLRQPVHQSVYPSARPSVRAEMKQLLISSSADKTDLLHTKTGCGC